MYKISNKIIAIIIILTNVILFANVSAFADVVMFEDPAKLSVTDDASFEPYPVAQNATKYTPWFTMYHMQTEEHYNRGLRGGEGGQMIMSFDISPVNPNLMLMGSDMGGLWRSIDGGENWYSLTDNNNMRAGMGIAFHPEKENVVFSIQGNKGVSASMVKKAASTSIDGLYRSMDGGISWKQVLDKDIICDATSQGLIQFDSNSNVYVLTSDGVYKSENDGTTWTKLKTVDATPGGVYTLYVSEDGQMIVTATEKSGISMSVNGGLTWTKRNGSLSENACSFAVDPANSNRWYAVFPNDSSILYYSDNKGDTWKGMYYGYVNKAIPRVIKAIRVPSLNTVRLFLLYNGLSRPIRYSDNGGKTWIEPQSNYLDTFTKSTGYNVEALSFCKSNPNIALYSFGDVIYKSTDCGASFTWSNGGYSGNYASDFDFDEDGKLLISFVDRGMARTDLPYTKGNFSTAKLLKTGGTVRSTAIDPDDKNHMFISFGSSSNQELLETDDGGVTWNPRNIISEPACGILEYHKTNHNIIYTTSHTSFDGGNTWRKNSMYISSVSPVNSNVVYAIGDDSGVYKSTDCGETWNLIRSKYSEPKVIMADRFDENTVWIGCYNGAILKVIGTETTVYGRNGLNGLVTFSDAQNTVSALAQDPENANHLLAGMNGVEGGTKTCGLFETYDGGENWTIVKGLPSSRTVQTIVFSTVPNEILIGTCSEGTIIYSCDIYRQWLNETLTIDKSDEILLPSDNEKIRVRLNGETLSFADSQQPYEDNGIVYLPFEKIMSKCGYDVVCSNDSNSVVASKYDAGYTLTAESDIAYYNSTKIQMSANAILQNGVLFVPYTFFGEIYQFDVSKDTLLRRIELSYFDEPRVTLTPGVMIEGITDITESVSVGNSITLEADWNRRGYELTGWTDQDGNIYLPGTTVVISHDSTFTAIWERTVNTTFYKDGTRYEVASEAAQITEDGNYTVDCLSPYEQEYNMLGRKNQSDSSKQYMCYKFDISNFEDLSKAYLCLPYSKVNNSGAFYVYGAEGIWNKMGFGNTGVKKGNIQTFESDVGFLTKTAQIFKDNSNNLTKDNEDKVIKIDVSDYILEQKKSNKTFAAFYVMDLTYNQRSDYDTIRLFGLDESNAGARPYLKIDGVVKYDDAGDDIMAFTENSTTYIQFDKAMEYAGFDITYNSNGQTVIAANGNLSYSLTAGDNCIHEGDNTIMLDDDSIMNEGVLFVPYTAFTKLGGFLVDVSDDGGCVYIRYETPSINVRFFMQGEKNQFVCDAVQITEDGNYTVDYLSPYVQEYTLLGRKNQSDNVKQYMCYKFDISDAESLSNAVLCLPYSSVNDSGNICVYGAEGTWDNSGFGGTGVTRENVKVLENDDAFLLRTTQLFNGNSETLTNENEDKIIRIDVSDYVCEQKEKNKLFVAFYVMDLTYAQRDNYDTISICSLNEENLDRRPYLELNGVLETDIIRNSGTVKAQIFGDGRTFVPVIAFYNNADGVKKLETTNVGAESSDIKRDISINIDFDNDKLPAVKVFLWNNLNDMYPISYAYSLLTLENSYKVLFKSGCDNAAGYSPKNLYVEKGAPIRLPCNTFIRNGYRFVGWSDGTNVYKEGEKYVVGDVDVIFTAIWAESKNITFVGDKNTSGNAPATIGAVAGETVVLPENTFTYDSNVKIGEYEFVGWEYCGNTYAAGSNFVMPDNDVEFIATFRYRGDTANIIGDSLWYSLNSSDVYETIYNGSGYVYVLNPHVEKPNFAEFYLRFNVGELVNVDSAILQINCATGGRGGTVEIYELVDDWGSTIGTMNLSKTSITYDAPLTNLPSAGNKIYTSKAYSYNGYQDVESFDLTDFVKSEALEGKEEITIKFTCNLGNTNKWQWNGVRMYGSGSSGKEPKLIIKTINE